MLNKLKNTKTEKILILWDELAKREKTDEVFYLRGLMMDILEEREPEKFNAWLDGNEDIKKYF